jgi:hypothetical protein
MRAGERLLCPSHKCASGAQLIGIVQADGSVAFLGNPLSVDRQFVEIASQGRPPELRFRFASACAEGGCANWGANGCGIAAQISRSDGIGRSELPDCGIRPQCRWFRDRGANACAACPEIVRGSEGTRAGGR